MIDYLEFLERDLGRVGPAPFEFDDVVRRRDRRQRNRRIAAGALALGLALLVIGGWLGAVTFDRSTPADDDEIPRIDLPSAPDDWTRVRFPGTRLRAITAGGPGLVAFGEEDGTAIWTSSEGRTWDRVEQRFSTDIQDVTTGGPGLVAVGSQAEGAPVWISADGDSWSQAAWEPSFEDAQLQAVVPGGPGVVAVGSDAAGPSAWYSSDGATWQPASVPRPPDGMMLFEALPEVGMDVAALDGRLVAVGQIAIDMGDGSFRHEQVVWTSDDGITWAETEGSPIVANFGEERIVADADGFVVVGTFGIWTSGDGERWKMASGPDLRFHRPMDGFYVRMMGVGAGSGGFVATGRDFECALGPVDEGRLLDGDPASCRAPQVGVWTSPDGVTWTRVAPDPRFETLNRVEDSLVTAWGSRFIVATNGSPGVMLWISDLPASGSS